MRRAVGTPPTCSGEAGSGDGFWCGQGGSTCCLMAVFNTGCLRAQWARVLQKWHGAIACQLCTSMVAEHGRLTACVAAVGVHWRSGRWALQLLASLHTAASTW
jgi:hypothetical protein